MSAKKKPKKSKTNKPKTPHLGNKKLLKAYTKKTVVRHDCLPEPELHKVEPLMKRLKGL